MAIKKSSLLYLRFFYFKKGDNRWNIYIFVLIKFCVIGYQLFQKIWVIN